MSSRKTIAIIGAGPAALLLAAHLDEQRFDVHLFERNAAPARKFLVAGEGGFNLTHSEPMDAFVKRYTPPGFLDATLRRFTNEDLRRFLLEAGIPTFAGTSGRVFPEKGIKPVQVLDAILKILEKKKVHWHLRHRWTGWRQEMLRFETPEGETFFSADITVLALGGGSWKVTGSDGGWIPLLAEKGIRVLPLQPSNCAVNIFWPEELLKTAEGMPLKNIAVRCGDRERKGELVITARGLEGGAVYFHSACVRQQLSESGSAKLSLDLRPDLSEAQVLARLEEAPAGKSRAEQLRQTLGLSKIAVALLRLMLPKTVFLDDAALAARIKALPLTVTGLATLEEAISSVGGVATDEVDAHFGLEKLPGVFVIGEMLDWDAPTGGYLLQACFSMGFALADFLNSRER